MNETKQSLRIIIGMPGSGKTAYLKKLRVEGIVDCYFDDYQKGAPKDESNPHLKSDPHLSPNYTDLMAAISAGMSVAIADIRYCVPEEQKIIEDFAAAEFPEITLIVVYFANDSEACRHNVRLRNRKGRVEKELHNIDIITPDYNPPQNLTIPVIMG